MLEVPGGSYKIGTDNQIIPADREGPAKLVELPAFFLDVHEVSNAEFNLFVEETQYTTEAETFGNSFVAEYYVSEEVKAAISQAVAAAPWWLPVEVPPLSTYCVYDMYFQRVPTGEILRVQAQLWMVGVTIRWFMSAGMTRKPIAGHTSVSYI